MATEKYWIRYAAEVTTTFEVELSEKEFNAIKSRKDSQSISDVIHQKTEQKIVSRSVSEHILSAKKLDPKTKQIPAAQ